MLVALLGRRHGPAELALEAVDGGAKAPGIDEIVVGVTLEILDRRLEIVPNIRRADVTRDQGWVLLEVSGEPEELDKGVDYLESRGVKVEPAEGDLVE